MDVTAAILEFFSSGKLLKQWNATTLIFTTKIQNATSFSDFRLISCCNTLYKIISRLLANRMLTVLPSLISSNQSEFIHCRLLVENVLLATELIHGYNWKSISKRALLKIDLKKAFDWVKWGFVINLLKAMNFPNVFIALVHQCITTTSFSIAINGELCGYFPETQCLRQGDSMSPYLFVLVMEAFSRLLQTRFDAGTIGFHLNATEPEVTHLAFADDLMVFFDGTRSSLREINDTMALFSQWSGIRMNSSKMDLFTTGINQQETSTLARFGFSIGSLQI